MISTVLRTSQASLM